MQSQTSANNPTSMDPIVLVHARALLANNDQRTIVVAGDARDPEPTMPYTREIVRLYLDKEVFSEHDWT